LPYIMAARTAGIDRNEEITLPSPYVFTTFRVQTLLITDID